MTRKVCWHLELPSVGYWRTRRAFGSLKLSARPAHALYASCTAHQAAAAHRLACAHPSLGTLEAPDPQSQKYSSPHSPTAAALELQTASICLEYCKSYGQGFCSSDLVKKARASLGSPASPPYNPIRSSAVKSLGAKVQPQLIRLT